MTGQLKLDATCKLTGKVTSSLFSSNLIGRTENIASAPAAQKPNILIGAGDSAALGAFAAFRN